MNTQEEDFSGEPEISFEYTSIHKAILFTLISIVCLLCGAYALLQASDQNSMRIIFYCILFCIVVFWVFKWKSLKIKARATINKTYCEIITPARNYNIAYNNVTAYKISFDNGAKLVILLENKKKIKLVANKNFCDYAEFASFSRKLEEKLLEYSVVNNHPIVRIKSWFEHKLALPFLITLSLITGGALIFTIVIADEHNLLRMLICIGCLITLWVSYAITVVGASAREERLSKLKAEILKRGSE